MANQKCDAAPSLHGFKRYAIYYAPRPEEPLARFGEGWLGRSESGEDRSRSSVQGLPAPQETLTVDARRYGLHATLKAPFALAPKVDVEDLDVALARFAATRPVAELPRWRIAGDYGFTALRPDGACSAVDALAAGVVAHFARFGAAPSAETLAKRRAENLSARREAYLVAYGYPYVFEEFGFHVTLTGRLEAAAAAQAREALGVVLKPVLDAPALGVRDLCLFGDPGEGRAFVLLRRYALAPRRMFD